MLSRERFIMKEFLMMIFEKIDIMKSQLIEKMRKHVSSWVFKEIMASGFEQTINERQ